MKTFFSSLLVSFFLFTAYYSFAQTASSKSLKMNGSTQFVNCGTVNLSGSQVTLQGWINVQAFKPPTAPSPTANITSFIGIEQPGSAQCQIRIGDGNIPNDRVQFVIYSGSAPYKVHSATALSANTWYHLATTYDGSVMKIYINGILDTSLAVSIPIAANGTFELGRSYDNTRILNGELDEVSAWTTALSESTIRDWMCKRITPSHPNYSQLEAYWPLDEGSGTTTADLSGNGHTGTLQSAPLWRNSGAAIGNASKHVYANVFNIGIGSPNGDSINFESSSGSISGAHVYRLNVEPYVLPSTSGIIEFDTTNQYGIFPIGTATYDVDYYYNGNPMVSGNDCSLSFVKRANAGVNSWPSQVPDSVNYPNQTLSFESTGRAEIALISSNNGSLDPSFVVTDPTCNGDQDGSITATVTGGIAPYTFLWSTGSSSNQIGSLDSGIYYVTITDNYGCLSTDSVVLDDPDLLNVTPLVTNSTCLTSNNGSISLFIPSGQSGLTYLWNDPANSTTSAVLSLFPGTYFVTITNQAGCDQVESAIVGSVGPDPEPELGDNITYCIGSTLELQPGNVGGPFTSYLWSDGSTSPTFGYTGTGIVSVTVTNAQGCSGSSTASFNPVTPVNVQLGPTNQGGNGSLTLNAGPGFASYFWNTTATSQSIIVVFSGTYWVEVEDDNGCISRDSVKVSIFPSGIGETVNSKIELFPNPTNDILNFSIDQNLTVDAAKVFSADGKIMNVQLVDNRADFSNVSAGIYFVELTFNNGRQEILKVIKN